MTEIPPYPTHDASIATATVVPIEPPEGGWSTAEATRPLVLINVTDNVVTHAFVNGVVRETNPVGRTCDKANPYKCLDDHEYKELFQLRCGTEHVSIVLAWRVGDGWKYAHTPGVDPDCASELGWGVILK